MLHIVAFINNLAIDRVDILNTGITNRKGQYKYKVSALDHGEKVMEVWHRREDGWMKLTEKACRAIRRQKEGTNGKR
jgi:hypothetical protein